MISKLNITRVYPSLLPSYLVSTVELGLYVKDIEPLEINFLKCSFAGGEYKSSVRLGLETSRLMCDVPPLAIGNYSISVEYHGVRGSDLIPFFVYSLSNVAVDSDVLVANTTALLHIHLPPLIQLRKHDVLMRMAGIIYKVNLKGNTASFLVSLPVGFHHLSLSLNGNDYHIINFLVVIPPLNAPHMSSNVFWTKSDVTNSPIVLYSTKFDILMVSPCSNWIYR